MVTKLLSTAKRYAASRDERVVDIAYDEISELLTVITVSKYHNCFRYVFYYDEYDETVNILSGVSGALTR